MEASDNLHVDQTASELTEEPCYFLALPTELILRICDFLDSDIVIEVLGKVCEFFAVLAADDLIWKTRIHKRWPNKRYPLRQVDAMFDWKQACMEREREYRRWTDISNHINRTDIPFGFCVDVVHITSSNHLIMGLRDHTLYSIKLSDIPMPEQSELGDGDVVRDVDTLRLSGLGGRETFQRVAHKGWIWTISSDEEKICSGSWDSKVLLWDYAGQQLSLYKCGSAVLCSTMTGNEILAGTFNKTLVKIDTRVASPVSTILIPRRPILCVEETPNWAIIGNESRQINIMDKKTLKIYSTLRLPAGFPRSMSLKDNLLYVGTKSGIHVYSFDEALGRLTFLELVCL
ncbi:F-box/WD repeat-containing protein 9-like isoform X2 [Watersipora subatra]|uniref:F-box/WD repeat-containing protein 9-like isoform X2 n=1 Tax=Watersipora subatra TaxID=2589382 RepID=UPI00355B2667